MNFDGSLAIKEAILPKLGLFPIITGRENSYGTVVTQGKQEIDSIE